MPHTCGRDWPCLNGRIGCFVLWGAETPDPSSETSWRLMLTTFSTKLGACLQRVCVKSPRDLHNIDLHQGDEPALGDSPPLKLPPPPLRSVPACT